MTSKEEIAEIIKDLTEEFRAKNYDPEGAHGRYDWLLEQFILGIDKYDDLLPGMIELIKLEKTLWYA